VGTGLALQACGNDLSWLTDNSRLTSNRHAEQQFVLESLSVLISPLAGSSNDVNKLLACTIQTKFSSVLMTPRF